MADSTAAIGELDVAFEPGVADRYLWDFATLPEWRGRGVYPRLLQSILLAEGTAENRFWIINAPENAASENGIRKAGFRVVGELAFAEDARAGLVPTVDLSRAQIGASLLGVPIVDVESRGVSPCWCCVMDAVRQGARAACWPEGPLGGSACTCGPRPPGATEAPGFREQTAAVPVAECG